MMIGATLVVTPGASAEMEAPTISAKPALDGQIEETEWGISKSFSFNAPRVSSSGSVRMGYLDSSGELALGFVLPDETDQNDDKLTTWIAPRRVESGDGTEDEDLRIEIEADGSWELYHGYEQNDSRGFESAADASGSSPSATPESLAFSVDRTASSWVVEMVVDIGSFEAGETIHMGFRQTDVDAQDTEQTTTRPSNLDEAKPATWERTVLSGRPSTVQLQILPPDMEAAVGGEVIVTLPADAKGGRLTVSVQGPGESGFTPIGTRSPGNPGQNTFFFAPEKVGTYKIKADWEGDDNYQRTEVGPKSVKVARPTPAGPTVLETGSMRVAFPLEAAGSPGEWEYLNTRVWATNQQGETLPLVRLDSSNSCRKDPWVGFANMGSGPITLHFDPPVRRGALALTSPEDSFTATWKAYTKTGSLKEEDTESGNCGGPVFASVGDIEDTIKRVQIDYTGEDEREVIDVAFGHPLKTTPPVVTARAYPSPLRADGVGEIVASAGSPHRLTKASVTVSSGTQTLATRTCDRPASQVWIQCPVDVQVPPGTGSVRVEVRSTDRFGTTFTGSSTLVTEEDGSPPKATLLPSPLLAPPGGAVSVTAAGTDASGVQNITLKAHTAAGEPISNASCEAPGKQIRFQCKLAVTPPEDQTAFVTATYTDRAGNSVTVGPKPIPVRGEDKDGDGLPNPLEKEIGTSSGETDTDGDGLPDGWEVIGVDRNGDGQAEIDLAARGADPQVKDLFLEVDWAQHRGHTHKPAYGALQVLRNTFAAHGIQVHTDIAQEGGPFNPARFDHGHEAHRHLIDHGRAGIFMHVIAGHLGGPSAGGGWTVYLPTDTTDAQVEGRVGAQLLHEVGHQLGLGHGGGGTIDSKDGSRQAAFAEDYKPNYLSVMNDAYAWGLIVDTTSGLIRVPTYAGFAIGDLDENSLDEPAGTSFDLQELQDTLKAGPTPLLEKGTVSGLRLRYTCPDEGPIRWALAPGPVDWNCNGSSGDKGVKADVNRGGANSGISKLYSRTDWDSLSFAGAPCPQYALMINDEADAPASEEDHGEPYAPLGLAPCPLHPPPVTPLDKEVKASVNVPGAPEGELEEADRRDNDEDGVVDDGFADTDGDGIVNLIDDCPTGADASQADLDSDGRGDWCQAAPPKVSGLTARLDPDVGGVRVSWSQVFDVWGYNVYRTGPENVTRLGDGFPSTTSTTLIDPSGSRGDTYIVRAVNTLADQGPPATVVAQRASAGDDGAGDTNGTGNGTDAPRESVPGPGSVLLLGLTGLAAMALRRRRRR